MLYMVADNDREYYLRKGYVELATSSAINKSDAMRTWIYFDGFNQGEDGQQPLFDTVDSSGDILLEPFTGSRIITYDALLGKFRVAMEYDTEQNSDLPSTLQSFLEHALSDCLKDGYDSLFLGMAGYGGDFWGFGGDQNHRRQRRRDLLQSNQDIASGIRSALENVGGPDRVDVIGFDAGLMMDIGVGADYFNVSKHILASESVVPGDGWPYSNLTAQADAVTFAGHILQTYLEPPGQGFTHESPKTMSLMDTEKYETFLEIWESMSEALLYSLKEEDPSLYAFVSRAQQSAIAFDGGADGSEDFHPSSLDIGSFLRQLLTLCNPTGSNLIVVLDVTKDVYNEMFITRGHGPGSAAGTGMHVTWPSQAQYAANTELWDTILFNQTNSVTRHTPIFRKLLRWFLSSSPPGGDHDGSVCNERAVAINETDGGPLIITEQGGQDDATGIMDILRASIASSVSQVEVLYGIDLTAAFTSLLFEAGYERQQDEYWYLLGGDAPGRYFKSEYRASWDKHFFFFNISGELDPVYVSDRQDGAKQIHVLYFPTDHQDVVANLTLEDYLLFDWEHWKQMGGQTGFLIFSVDILGNVNDNLALFTRNEHGVLAEQPRKGGGSIIPLVYVDAYWQGKRLDVIPGGLNRKFYSWSPENDCQVARVPAKDVSNVIPVMETILVNMYAHSVVNTNIYSEIRYFDALKPEAGGRFSPVAEKTNVPLETSVPVLNSEQIPDSSPSDSEGSKPNGIVISLPIFGNPQPSESTDGIESESPPPSEIESESPSPSPTRNSTPEPTSAHVYVAIGSTFGSHSTRQSVSFGLFTVWFGFFAFLGL